MLKDWHRYCSGAIILTVLLFQFLPMDAFSGAAVHGFLDFIGVSAALIDHYGIALFFIQLKYFRADFLTGTAGDAFGIDNVGNPHFTHRLLLG